MEMTSNCDVTNSAHQIQMTTIWPWTKTSPWKFSPYATGSLTLGHIGHTRTNNGFFKLVEALLQTHSCFFLQSTNVRGLPLSACHCLTALPAKMCSFNSLMQQNACYRNIKWTFAGLLSRYCYATKTNSRTICSRLSQPASAGKGGYMSELQAHYCMTL